MLPVFIIVNKIIRKEGQTSFEQDQLDVSDIKSWRKWNKKGKEDEAVEGEITLLTIRSETGDGGFYNIHIKEAVNHFSERMRQVTKVVGLETEG